MLAIRFDQRFFLLNDIMIPGDVVESINYITLILLPAVATLDVPANTPMQYPVFHCIP
jgi:hypothetical protein